MNKKLITLAVAAAVAAPMTAMAEVTIFGVGHVSYDGIKLDGSDRTYKVVSNQPVAGAPRSSRIGFKGSEDLGGGLKAIWKMEFAFDQSNNSNISANRNSYVGLASDSWGTALMGRHDTPYKMATGKYDYFADQIGDFNGTVGFEDLRAQNVLAYVSPNWAGFTLAAAAVSPGVQDNVADAYSIAGMYSNAGFNISLAYERFDDAHLDGTVDRLNVAEKKWTVGGSYDMGAFGIAGRYSNHKDRYSGGVNVGDADLWQVSGKYGFGNNVVKAFWGQNDTDNVSDVDTWGVGWDHNLTKRTQAYIQWVDVDDTWDGFSLGMVHKF